MTAMTTTMTMTTTAKALYLFRGEDAHLLEGVFVLAARELVRRLDGVLEVREATLLGSARREVVSGGC